MNKFYRAVFFLSFIISLNVLSAQDVSSDSTGERQVGNISIAVEEQQTHMSTMPKDIWPEKRTDMLNENTEILIRSNVQNASVFLNGIYQGRTPLTINNLVPGIYDLVLEKEGYTSQYFFLNVYRGQQLTYYIQLEKSIGWISIYDAPPQSSYYVDGELQYTMPLEVATGFHTITVKNFGYNDVSTSINIEPYSHTSLSVSMTKAQFNVSDIKTTRTRFNPTYSNAFGKAEFSFSVTAPGDGIFTVTDAYGNTVHSQHLDFTTWSQYVSWDGLDSDGNVLPDGEYTATVTADGITKHSTVYIDRRLAFVPCDFTPGGSGIGPIAGAFMLPEKTFFLAANVTPTFYTSDNPFAAVPIAVSFGFTPLSWLEISARANIHVAMPQIPTSITIATKLIKTFSINMNTNFSVGALIRWGMFTGFRPAFTSSGIDTGTGLSGGVTAAFSTNNFYAGISSEYTFGAATGNLSIKDSVWRNGISFQIRPTYRTAIQAWCALNSAFNIYDAETQTASDKNNWANAIDTGISTSIFINNTTFMLNAGAHASIFFKDTSRIGVSIGGAWLF